MKLYSMHDRKMNVYLTPFPARGDVDAIRNVKTSSVHPDMKNTPVGEHPEDFDLVYLGEFDDESGDITRAGIPMIIGNVAQIIAPSTVPS
ncbi:nonstructural protein [Apis mellifera associated microvirus 5]|nr:nonstructural protein [Apis mellifera associated microvirus 5]AZL82840.1 nonstructural protein [Apis mellifera associated microvirus 5]